MMTIHKEGRATLVLGAIVLLAGYYIVSKYALAFTWLYSILALAKFGFLLSFFRKPLRKFPQVGENEIIAPADGKVVVIEKVFESEFLKKDCTMVSIFMSPLNVHINWYPNQGNVIYEKYHKGKYLVAWNPKSSTENERTTVVQQLAGGKVLMRQVAGALARRIVCYAKTQSSVIGGDEMGFIKFGSRVDIYLPVDAKIHVSLEERVTGCQTRIATL